MDDKIALATLAHVARNATGWQRLEKAGISPKGTMRKWFDAHDGEPVALVQITVDGEGHPRDLFAPGYRTVRARPSSAQLDGSTRDYAGCRVLHGGDDDLVVVTNWGDDERQIMWFWSERGLSSGNV